MTIDQKIALMSSLAMAMAGPHSHLLGMGRLAALAKDYDQLNEQLKSETYVVPLEVAMKVIAQAIVSDHGHRDAWVANIARQFITRMNYRDISEKISHGIGATHDRIFEIVIDKVANDAANAFIDLLITDLTTSDDELPQSRPA